MIPVCKAFCLLLLQVLLRLPDDSPAAGVPVKIQELTSSEHWSGTTNQEGAVFSVFNIPNVAQTTVEVGVCDDPLNFPVKCSVTVHAVTPLDLCRWPAAQESPSTHFISE